MKGTVQNVKNDNDLNMCNGEVSIFFIFYRNFASQTNKYFKTVSKLNNLTCNVSKGLMKLFTNLTAC